MIDSDPQHPSALKQEENNKSEGKSEGESDVD